MDSFLLLALLAALGTALTLSQLVGHGAPDADDAAGEGDPAQHPGGLAGRHLAALNYAGADDAAAARRALLAMGTGIAPALLERVEAVDASPTALRPRAQLRIESVLADFGAGGYVAARHRIAAVDDRHAAAPAIVRIVVAMGPVALQQVVREDTDVRWRVLVPALVRAPQATLDAVIVSLGDFAPELRTELASALTAALAVRDDGPELDELPGALIVAMAESGGCLREPAQAEARARGLALPVADVTAAATFSDALTLPAQAEQSGSAGVDALVAWALADPDGAAPLLSRRLRAANWPSARLPELRACVRAVGPRAARVVAEMLRFGRDESALLARRLASEIDGGNSVAALLGVVGAPRDAGAALLAGEAVLRAGARAYAEVLQALAHQDIDVRRGAATLAGLLGGTDAARALVEAAARGGAERSDMLRALEAIGAAAAALLAEALRSGKLDRADGAVARVAELVTLLAEGRGA